jgi:sterol 3beta-glucosyltransferase
MRVTILAIGSRGDVQPFIALGLALQAHGHDIHLATHPRFAGLIEDRGLGFAPIAEGDLSRGRDTVAGRRWIESDSRRLPTWVGFLRDARSVASRRLLDAAAACADADAIIASNLAMVIGWQMAAAREIPFLRAFIGPPAWMLSKRPAPRAAPLIRELAWLGARPWLNRIRHSTLGLPSLPRREPFTELDRRGLPVLYAFSPAVLNAPAGLAGRREITGFWFLDHGIDPAPSDTLSAFLTKGSPPVAVGFSTMIDADPAHRTRLAVDALARAGVRGVLQDPAQPASAKPLSSDVLCVGDVSHQWLFPRCAAVVHHGAVGTTAAALRAGVPAVTIPHMTDQFVWARRLHELGASPEPIPRRELTVGRLAEAIRRAVTDEEMRRRAGDLGTRIATEDGVAQAVDVFERFVAHPSGTRGPAFAADISV